VTRAPKDGERLVAGNRKALHDYDIVDRYEAGMMLSGTEVKSLRDGRANLKDSFVRIEHGEPVLVGCHISVYDAGSYNNHEPERARKLLLSKKQIADLHRMITEKGLSVIPLRIYFKGSWAKVEIGVGRGKKLHDKRDAMRDRDLDREARTEMKERRNR
jgi:SsrA-binding protein